MKDKNEGEHSELGLALIESIKEGIAFARGEDNGTVIHKVVPPEAVDVKAIRQRLDLSQRAFAAQFGFTLTSVRNWEQGIRRPQGPARILLKVIERHPDAVLDALTA